MHSIVVKTASELVEVKLSGMIAESEVVEYVQAIRHKLVVNHRSYRILIDVTECPIQSQAVVTAFGKHIATMPNAKAIAIVVGGSLFRMQVQRLFTQPYARIVATAEEGRAWVLHGAEPALARRRV